MNTTAVSVSFRPASNIQRSSHLRLTTRGRLVLTMLLTVPLVGGAFLMVTNGGAATASNHSAVAPLQYVTVQAGQSLWQLATQISPSSDPRDVVADIAQLNQLPTGDIQAGQRLAIPARYDR